MSSTRKRYSSKNQIISSKPKWKGLILIIIGLLIIGSGVYLINQSFANPIKQATSSTKGVISVDDAYDQYIEGAYFLDVRTKEEWGDYHIPNTNLIPLEELPLRVDEVPKNENIVIVCRSGNRSQMGRDFLIESGYAKVFSMSGGIKSWMSMNFPTVEGSKN